MKKTLIVFALAGMTAGASGCCCCRALFPQTAAVVPAPVPGPACPPPTAYDPCSVPPVTYAPAPAAGYAPGTAVYAPPQW